MGAEQPADDGTFKVILMGSMGVGKSTLINTLVGSPVARTLVGATSCTKELSLYDS